MSKRRPWCFLISEGLSNPVAGRGRAGILIMPKAVELSKNTVVLEFKQTADKEKLENAAREGLA